MLYLWCPETRKAIYDLVLACGLSFYIEWAQPHAFSIFNDPFAKLSFDWMTETLTVRTIQNQ